MSTTDSSPAPASDVGLRSAEGSTTSRASRAPGPHTLSEIRARIEAVRDELAAWFGGLPVEDLFLRLPGEWAPIDDLRHLVRVNAALARGLGYPRALLRVRFGRPARESWTYDRLAVIYDALLSTGVKSPAPFEPRTGVVADREAYRDRVLGQWRSVNAELLGRIGRLTESALDRAALPHPGLGLLTLREMLFFTIHHDLHHLEVAKRRLARAPDA